MPPACNPASKAGLKPTLCIDDKVSFLGAPESYREQTATVSIQQTSHAWLFLTERHVYKMKKPYRRGGFDFSTLESRRALCHEEYRLNRRLARKTYLGVVPLVIDVHDNLALDTRGCPVEWLVKMKRLPADRTLLAIVAAGKSYEVIVAPLMNKLLRFQAQAPPMCYAVGQYPARLRSRIRQWAIELRRPEFEISSPLVAEVDGLLCRYLENAAGELERRNSEGRIRELHGDLRPEHVFFAGDAEPEIIDCIEFDADLRRLDCVEEIAFLGMECRRAGQISIEKKCIEFYGQHSDDTEVTEALWHFHAALSAMIRAGLAAWHMLEHPLSGRWARATTDYLQLASSYARQLPPAA